uniref:Replication initiation protein n=1 Tax=Zymomonas mobilis subsp. mobilis (strain NCIMB 11163 / B70) TaxID=622759 RepID=D0U3P5_ZYMMN|nr:protein rep [Zymomonas mobilis]ACY38608.1 replication initiation protein [Zymomonas mobilis subsp. mobilis NCIMB 11163]
MHFSATLGHNIKANFLKCKSNNGFESDKNGLVDYSPKDRFWDVHKLQADSVEQIYQTAKEFERYAERISNCSGVLRFAVSEEGAEKNLKLKEAKFCRVRHCPICQWRRSLMWQARFYTALPEVLKEHVNTNWLFLTLTVRNCEIGHLRATLQDMAKAWQRLIKRKAFKPVNGWIRTTEVTRGKDGSAHPHFHCLLMVRPSYFKKYYISQSSWIDLWQQCMKVPYSPNIDVRRVKGKKGEDENQALKRAVSETLKYAVKPHDMISDKDWFLELTKQVHQLRFIASGGLLKDILKENLESNQDLISENQDNSFSDNKTRLAFNWQSDESRYRRFYDGDIF